MSMTINVGRVERWAAGLAGAALLVSVWIEWGPWRQLGAALLFFRAGTGYCGGYQLLGVNSCKIKPKP